MKGRKRNRNRGSILVVFTKREPSLPSKPKRYLKGYYGCGSTPMVPFWGAPPILEPFPILIRLNRMFIGGTIWLLTHGHTEQRNSKVVTREKTDFSKNQCAQSKDENTSVTHLCQPPHGLHHEMILIPVVAVEPWKRGFSLHQRLQAPARSHVPIWAAQTDPPITV